MRFLGFLILVEGLGNITIVGPSAEFGVRLSGRCNFLSYLSL